MARARNIKPGIFKNELLGVADPLLTILFAGLWCLADKRGRLEDRPLRIKAEIFPYRELPGFNGYLTDLARLGFIRRYQAEGQLVIDIPAFEKHQHPHHTEKDSVLPEFPVDSNGCSLTGISPLANSTSTDTLRLIPDSLIPDSGLLKPDSLITESPLTQPAVADLVQTVFDYWKFVMAKGEQAKLTPKRSLAVRNILKLGYSVEEIKKAIDGCHRSPHHMGQNAQRTIYDDLELICRSGEKLEGFINCAGAGAGVETIDQTRERIDAQADRVALWLQDNQP